MGVPTQAGPPGQWEAPTPPPSPRATSQHWVGGQKPGAGPGGPSCPLGGGAQHWPPQQLGTEGEARAGKFTGSELAGHPQTAPAWGPQPFPGSKGGAEAATHGPQAMLTWQTLPSHRAHAEGSGASPVFGAGTQQAMGTAVPQTRGHGALSLSSHPPLLPHPVSPTVGSGWGCPPTAVGQQIPEPALTSKIVQPHTAKAGGLPLGSPHPPPPRWARGGDGTSPLFPSPHSRTRSIILPRSPLEMQARTEVLTPSISAPRLTSLAAPSPCAGGLGGHVCADASSGKTRW